MIKINKKYEKHIEKYQALGLNIAYYRKKRDMTQENLADIVGLSRTHISNIEATKMDISFSLSALFDIADALGVDTVKLLEQR